MQEKLEKSLIGACGVFYASAELSRHGWIAMPTIRNTRGIDIVATKGEKVANIQVKTNSYGKAVYPLNVKDEDSWGSNVYYVFVTLRDEDQRPDFYVLASQFVAEYIKKTHEKWTLMKPKLKKALYEKETKEGIRKKRANSAIRRFPNYIGKMFPQFKDFDINNYRDNWDLLDTAKS